MENNEIMQRLLQDDKPVNSNNKNEGTDVKAKTNDVSISRIRVVSAKYKVYIVLLLILVAALLIKYIPNATDAYNASKEAYDQTKVQLNNIGNDIKAAKEDMEFLCDKDDGIVSNEEAIIKCLNEEVGCSNLPEGWKIGTGEDAKYDFTIPLSYLQLHSLYNKKMPVDEKRVLKNLNEYLIKQDISGGDRNKVGDILRISIGDPAAVKEGDDHFFKVSVDVEIKFSTIDDLIEFLYNIEKKLINNSEDRILYKIQTVSYDIITNDEPQITDISMVAYYYHDDKFNDKAECEVNTSDNSDDNKELNEISDDGQDNEEPEMDGEKDFDSLYQEVFKDLEN